MFSLFFVVVSNSFSLEKFVYHIPNGKAFKCLTCHIDKFGGDRFNPFGLDVSKNISHGEVEWGKN